MRIALYSSKRARCGIATYSCHLEEALRRLGAEVRHWGSWQPHAETFSEMRGWSPDVAHVQYEVSIMPPRQALLSLATEQVSRGARAAITLHSESRQGAEVARAGFSPVILHRPGASIPQASLVTMPCPVHRPEPRAELRRRHGFPEDAFVLSTVGFLLPWKRTADIAAHLAPWLVRTRSHLQVIAPEHFSKDSRSHAEECSRALAKLTASTGGLVRHVSGYPPDGELVERLALSDLGYVYCPEDTGSSSAAASLFVSARCPLVTSTSTHYDHLLCRSARGPKGDPRAFAAAVVAAAGDQDLLLRLRASMEEMYAETNYDECAKRHLEIYAHA